MRLGALLDIPELGLRLLAGDKARDREFGRVFQATLRDPTRYLDGGEIVLCGLRWLPGPADADAFVGKLAAAGVTALERAPPRSAARCRTISSPPAIASACHCSRCRCRCRSRPWPSG